MDINKKLEQKVKYFNNTNTIFDGRRYVLLDDAKKIVEEEFKKKSLQLSLAIGLLRDSKCCDGEEPCEWCRQRKILLESLK